MLNLTTTWEVSLKTLGRSRLEAITSYNKAIEIQPEYAEAYNNLGNVLGEIGNANLSIISCQKAIIAKPDYGTGYRNLGNTLLNLGKTNEAIVSSKKATKLQ